MRCDNAFFDYEDAVVRSVAGFEIPPGWWSRPYEYAWALLHAPEDGKCADMGAGQFYRPLRDGLIGTAQYVYAVDADQRLLDQSFPKNVWPIVASFCERIDEIEDGELDAVYCISVLEHVPDPLAALMEFKRVLAPSGRIYITLDVPYNDSLPCEFYQGVNLDTFLATVELAGLKLVGEIDRNKAGAIHHELYNLTVFHCILERA